MAHAACKIIIDNGVRALSSSLEQVLMHPLVRGPMISAEKCDDLIQVLADVDLASYLGKEVGRSSMGMVGVLNVLYQERVITDEVYSLLRHPDNPPIPAAVRPRT